MLRTRVNHRVLLDFSLPLPMQIWKSIPVYEDIYGAVGLVMNGCLWWFQRCVLKTLWKGRKIESPLQLLWICCLKCRQFYRKGYRCISWNSRESWEMNSQEWVRHSSFSLLSFIVGRTLSSGLVQGVRNFRKNYSQWRFQPPSSLSTKKNMLTVV